MSNSAQEPREINQEAVNHALGLGEALLRLQKNSDFKKVILNGYLHEKVLASHSLLGVPSIKAQGHRPDIMEDLVSSSNLKYFFQMLMAEYEGAKNPILSDDEEAELARMQEEAAQAGLVN
jgi:hypothetical protein